MAMRNQPLNFLGKPRNIIMPATFYFIVVLLSGCALHSGIKDARGLALDSRNYYQLAVNRYQEIIRAGSGSDQAYFELGRLYYEHGEFKKAIDQFKKTDLAGAKKFQAISLYRFGNFVDALEVFEKHKFEDEEYLYYYGLTCEKLNLFDQALSIYKKIKSQEFGVLAGERASSIDKLINLLNIKEIDSKVAGIIAAAPSAANYPQAGGLILYSDENFVISLENTETYYLHYIVKILNERGKNDYAEAQIGYDSTFEKVELEYARTIKPDGKVVEVGSRHIRDVSKYLNFPLYSNARVFIISFPEITEGACVEYKLKVYRNRLINQKDVVMAYPLQEMDPVIFANFAIDLPLGRKLNLKFLNEQYNDFGAELKPTILNAGKRTIYRWQFRNLPQIMPEANMPPGPEINPTIILSTFQNWQEIHQWWWKLAQDKISVDPAIKEKVAELTRGRESSEAKIRAIYNFCAQKIRYVAVEYGQAGYEPHAARDIYQNKYGDCKDQVILLVAMLKEAGIPSWPVLISTKDYYNLKQDFPSMMFNHCIAAVMLGDKIIFLDPTAQTCSFGDLPVTDQDRQVMIIKEDTFEIKNTPLFPPGHNFSRQDLKVKINSDETVDVEKKVSTQGVYQQSQRYWLLYTPPELIREQLQEKIQEMSIGAKLDSYRVENAGDLDQSVLLSYNFKGPEYFTVAGLLRILPQLLSLDRTMVARNKRKYPIDLVFLEAQETRFELTIPPNFKIKYLPDNISEDSPWLRLEAEYKIQDNRILFKQNKEFKRNVIRQDEYPDFKKAFEGLSKKVKQRIVLEKINP